LRSTPLRVVVAVALAALGAALLPGGAAAAPKCGAGLAPRQEGTLNAMIARVRADQGVAKVAKNRVLTGAGRRKSLAMAKGAKFAHSADGPLPWAKGREAGQNIAMAPSAASAFQAMLESPGHRKNLLSPDWRFSGVGAAVRCYGMVFFTINLMAPR
jgi:uncharacterized protein YkwD